MKRTPMSRRYSDTGPSRETLAALAQRCGGRCELCGQAAEHTHHRRPRGIGSSRDPQINACSNLLRLCASCHRYVEEHRAEALLSGWLVSRYTDPASAPVLIDRGSRWVYLGETYVEHPEAS